MGDIGKLQSSRRRVDVAFALMQKQKMLVDSTRVGSPTHRSASEVLALLEESHFILTETHRILSDTGSDQQIDEVSPKQRKRWSLAIAVVSIAAFVAGAILLEIVDPAPASLQADVLRLTRSDSKCLKPRQCSNVPSPQSK